MKHRLPREAWLQFGGYSGWQVEVNHKEHLVEPGDWEKLERLTAELAANEFSHLCMTRYEEDSLTAHTNPKCAWLMYLRTPDDSGLYHRNPHYDGGPDLDEEFRCTCGISLEFPVSNTVTHDQARRAALEFFQTGELPQFINWAEL